jgi:hypothetical protein
MIIAVCGILAGYDRWLGFAVFNAEGELIAAVVLS